MFRKRKNTNKEPEIWYSLAIMTDQEMSDEDYDQIMNKIDDHVDKVGFSCNLTRSTSDKEYLIELEEKMNLNSYTKPSYLLFRISHNEIKAKEKALEKKHRFKHFFNLISFAEYDLIATKVMTSPRHLVFYSDSLEEAIKFLKEH
ncbi:hypothetical protein BpOF4_16460 [Alkalihalophilus pseudofirmus OF4]|uniref:Uncharacterized protein n=1 Tax=Alkalihalophilus pseudofirmus (strain ATCC BAA-2126 / JCM 17055 / OF4) TaxID=398511 RepID=D3FQ44_ALKPO|nr:hypothetical protein [Alkalihalophilus pseudofirmus]ADC51337.1 hypothetical protein BpOF4_16460 [Alkalihalophilus pseudofirmus OF4]